MITIHQNVVYLENRRVRVEAQNSVVLRLVECKQLCVAFCPGRWSFYQCTVNEHPTAHSRYTHDRRHFSAEPG